MARPQTPRTRHEVDARGVPLGRLASRVAILLRGKHKPTYAPYLDAGDVVHVINAGAVHISRRKVPSKRYHRFTGYPGGIRTATLKERRVQDPTGIIRDAVFGMLPRNRQRSRVLQRLTIDP
jgi:large subunit ribosomal protein L13